jgi:hypothetical protein
VSEQTIAYPKGHVKALDDLLASARETVGFSAELEHEVQTDKQQVKLVPCRGCERPIVVTTFFAPAKAICRVCKGESDTTVASVGQPIPGQTDPAKAVNLVDVLINPHFAIAQCPAHPDDESHEMKLINVVQNEHYGPGEWVAGPKGMQWRQTAKGESVRHQCQKCLATVDYSTIRMVKFRAVNEVQHAEDLGSPHRNSLLAYEGPDPTANRLEEVA